MTHNDAQHKPAALPCMNDCIFRLDNGWYDLRLAGAKPDGVAIVLFGGSVLYILREKETKG